MHRARAAAVLLLAALTFTGCADPEDPVAPRATRGALEGATPLVVEADLPVATLVVSVDDGLGYRATELHRKDDASPLWGALDVAPGTKAQVGFRAYDGAGHLTHEGGGVLLTDYTRTPQQEFVLAGPAAFPVAVRIGTYRLALAPGEIVGEPGRGSRVEAMLLDARGERYPIEKGALAWSPMEGQKGLGSARFEYIDGRASMYWFPEKWYVGRLKVCTIGDRTCGLVIVRDPNPVVQVEVGSMHACARRQSGVVSCWGDDVVAQLGLHAGTSVIASIPFRHVSAGSLHTCGADMSGNARCWGSGSYHQLGNATATAGREYAYVVSGLPDTVMQVAAGGQHSCALLLNGQAWCWGRNNRGQLGDGTAASASPVASTHVPVRVVNAPPFVKITAGGSHSCGLTAGGVAWCWGDNVAGQSGVAPFASDSCAGTPCSAIARQVQTAVYFSKLPLTFAGIGAGGNATCAWRTGGTGYCWGAPVGSFTPNGGYDQVPRTPTSQPTWKHFSAHGGFQCGIDTADMVHCFGNNGSGQTGTGTYSSTPLSAPTPVALRDVWTTVDGGYQHACGARSTFSIVSCWGTNHDGELGLGYWGGSSSTPVNVTALY